MAAAIQEKRPAKRSAVTALMREQLPAPPDYEVFRSSPSAEMASIDVSLRKAMDGYGPGRETALMQVCVRYSSADGSDTVEVAGIDCAPTLSHVDFTITLAE